MFTKNVIASPRNTEPSRKQNTSHVRKKKQDHVVPEKRCWYKKRKPLQIKPIQMLNYTIDPFGESILQGQISPTAFHTPNQFLTANKHPSFTSTPLDALHLRTIHELLLETYHLYFWYGKKNYLKHSVSILVWGQE